MSKRRSQQAEPTKMNSGNFLQNFAFKNFERHHIDSNLIINFNRIVYNIGTYLSKNKDCPQYQEIVKITTDLILGFEANLYAETQSRHQCTHEDILNFFNTISFFFVQVALSSKSIQKLSQSGLIQIYSSLLHHNLQNVNFKSLQNKVQLFNTITQTLEEPHLPKINHLQCVRQMFSLRNSAKKKIGIIKMLLISYLKHQQKNSQFVIQLTALLIQAVNYNHLKIVKNILAVYQHIGCQFSHKKSVYQDIIFRSLDSGYIKIVHEVSKQIKLSKIIEDQKVLIAVMKLFNKLSTKQQDADIYISLFEELDSIPMPTTIKEKSLWVARIDNQLITKIITWIQTRNVKGDFPPDKEKNEKFLEATRFLTVRLNESHSDLSKLYTYMSSLLKKIAKIQILRAKISVKDIDDVTKIRQAQIKSNPFYYSFFINIVPYFIQDLNINPKSNSIIKYAVLVKKAQIEAEEKSKKSLSLKDMFKQVYYQMLQTQSLNFHYVLCVIYIKYEKQREALRQIILGELIADLHMPDANKKNSRNLILNLSLFLKSIQDCYNTPPIKCRIKQLLAEYEKLPQRIEPKHLINVHPREILSNNISNHPFSKNFFTMRDLLNKQLLNYSCHSFNIFYTLIVAINDIAKSEQVEEKRQYSILNEINYMRRVSLLRQSITTAKQLQFKIDQALGGQAETNNLNQNKRSILLLLLKLNNTVKQEKINLQSSNQLASLTGSLLRYINSFHKQYENELLNEIQRQSNDNQSNKLQTHLSNCIEEKHMIKFYSETSINENLTNLVVIRQLLKLFKGLHQKIEKQAPYYNELRCFYLLYGFNFAPASLELNNQISKDSKVYIMLVNLNQMIAKGQFSKPLIHKIQANLSTISGILFSENLSQRINFLKAFIPLNFEYFAIKCIYSIFNRQKSQKYQLFQLITRMIDYELQKKNDRFQKLITKILLEEENDIFTLVIERAKIGINLSIQQRTEYIRVSQKFFILVKDRLMVEPEKFLIVVEELIQLDLYAEPERSAFILKEISSIFGSIPEKDSKICQIVFNYIVTITQIFVGQQKLQISTFICNFFGLEFKTQKQVNFSSFDKKTNLTCGGSGNNYRCMRCNQNKLVCLGCAITCHSGHPVCYYAAPADTKASTRCSCNESYNNGCKLNKENPSKFSNNIFSRPPIRNESPMQPMMPMPMIPGSGSGIRHYLGSPPPEILQKMRIRQHSFRFDREGERDSYLVLHDEELYEQELRYRQHGMARVSKIEKLIEREQGADISRIFAQFTGMKNQMQAEIPKQKNNASSTDITQYEPVVEDYRLDDSKIEEEIAMDIEQNNAIMKKQVLIPKFIELMINFCNKKSSKNKVLTNVQLWKLNYTPTNISRIPNGNSYRLFNPGSFNFQVRKQSNINISCVLIKRNISHSNKLIFISSGPEVHVFPKQRILFLLPDSKSVNGNLSIGRCNLGYQIHSVEVSPVDKNMLCTAGIHNLSLLNISPDGSLVKTPMKVNIPNLYINKIKLTKTGIFIGVQKQLRMLNYSCKHLLTIRAQQSNTLIRQWSIFEKAAGCQAYFVCPNGNIHTCQLLPGDQGKKEFIGKVHDNRQKRQTGASIVVKDISEMGRYISAGFKDGSNIFGHLQGDQVQDTINIQLKGLKFEKNIFDTFFIFGHIDFVKIPETSELFVVCTVKKYFPPQMGFQQGFLIAIKFKKDGTSQTIVINDEILCDFFTIVKVGKKNFFIISSHVDGSVFVTSFNKLSKQNVEEQLVLMRQSDVSEPLVDHGKGDNTSNLRKSIQEKLTLSKVTQNFDISHTYNFRQGSENFKTSDYQITRNGQYYEIKQINFNKIIMGFMLPFFGDADIVTRRIRNTFEVGFSYLQALYFYSLGTFTVKCKKNEDERYNRDTCTISTNNLRTIERFQSGPGSYSSEVMNNLMNSIKQDTKQEFIFVVKNLQSFKLRIPKFDEIFNTSSSDESSSIEKTALIIKMFLTKCLNEKIPLDNLELIQLVEGLKSIVAVSQKKLFPLIKELIKLSIRIYEQQTGRVFNFLTDENYTLRAATQNLIIYYFSLLKTDISQSDLDQFLELLVSILYQDTNLMIYYVAKYSGIFTHLHKRLKKADTQNRATMLIELYTFAYPILNYCEIPCAWILTSICLTTYSFINCVNVRQKLYQALRINEKMVFANWIKTICNPSEAAIEAPEAILPKVSQEQPRDPMAEYYQMFNMGQIDEESLLKMIQQLSQQEFNKKNEIKLDAPEEIELMQPELQMEMAMVAQQQQVNHNIKLHLDLVNECTQTFSENLEFAYSRILVLYVLSKVIVQPSYEEVHVHLIKKIQKLITEVDMKAEGDKLTSIICYCSLFNQIMKKSLFTEQKGGKSNPLYVQLQKTVYSKLSTIKLETVTKIKGPLNVLGKVFKGDKTSLHINIAYAITLLLLEPCEPQHVLLSLECYWLLPHTKEFYSRLKDESNIKEGIESGNIQKVYQTAKLNPIIWQESSYLEFMQKWVEDKKPQWELALQLMAIYYQQ